MTHEEQALVFRYAAEELEKRALCKQALVVADDGRKASFYMEDFDEFYFRARTDNELGWITYKSCERIVACCVIGSVDLAVACHADEVKRVLNNASLARLDGIDTLVRVLIATRRDEVVQVLEDHYGFPNWVGFGEFADAYAVLKALDENDLGEADIGDEGLLPLWNDHPSRTKGHVIELLRAAESAAIEARQT